MSQYITPLQSLRHELRPLKKMKFRKKGTQIKWSVDEEDVPSTGILRYQITLAFLSGLKDTDGKRAIWLLISQILQLLSRNELVKMTGSTSHVTSYYFWTGILGVFALRVCDIYTQYIASKVTIRSDQKKWIEV